mgnify:CR=1 FL=1
MAQYFEVHPVQPQIRLLKQAADILAKGGIAAIPTDSSYALVCRLDDKAAVDALRESAMHPRAELFPDTIRACEKLKDAIEGVVSALG